MQQYIYGTPQVLTDSIFLLYGGLTGTSSAGQREVAFTLAEEQMVEYLGSYLTPTIVTGTHFWKGKNPIELDYGWVRRVLAVTINSLDMASGCDFDSDSGCAYIRNAQYGYLDVTRLGNCSGCGSVLGAPPYNIQVAYETGFATGTYTSKAMLQSLVIVAQINLNEIDVSLSNESTADVGIESFNNQQYSERRKKLGTTIFGNSPMANRASRLIKKYRTKPSMGFH